MSFFHGKDYGLCLFQSERRLLALSKTTMRHEESFYLFSFDLNTPKLSQFRYINFKNNGSIYFFEAYANEIIFSQQNQYIQHCIAKL